jgi:DNA ligase-1
MHRLQQLLESLDTAANDAIKVQCLKSYFGSTPPEDAAWALFFLGDGKLKNKTSQRLLKEIIETQTGFPDWMIRECNDRVKDTAEALALLLPWSNATCELSLSTLVVQFLQPLSGFSQLAKRETIRCAWEMLNTSQRIIFNKMILGGFHLGAQKTHIHEALSEISGIPKSVISRRLIVDWEPSAMWFQGLMKPDLEMDQAMTPCAFSSITESDTPRIAPKNTSRWIATWAFEGLRVQAIRRREISTIWSSNLTPLNQYFPELIHGIDLLPSGTVLEGFIVATEEDHPTSSENLQKRLKDKAPNQKAIQTMPTQFIVVDITERHGVGLMNRPFAERRFELEQVMDEWLHQWTLHGNNPSNAEVNPDFFQQEMFDMDSVLNPEPETQIMPPPMRICELCRYETWENIEAALEKCRKKNATGLLLRELDSGSHSNSEDDAWKYIKPAPFRAKLVFVSAERSPGNQSQFSQFTFGAWHENNLVSVAVVAEHLTDQARESLSQFANEHTVKKLGNNYQIKPERICEISFEGIQKSPRSKSGIRLKNPRIYNHLIAVDLDQAHNLRHLIDLIQPKS